MVEPSSSGAELGGLPAALPLPRLALILGGTGFIGRAIARRFLAVGVPVRIVARSGREDAIEAGTEVEFVQGDAADPLLMQEALRGVDRVVYAVGQSLPRESNLKPIEDVFSALPPLLSVLEALRGVPGTGFTFLSSGGTVYGNPPVLPVPESTACDPITGYGITKLAAEKYIGMYARLHGVNATVLRVSNAYGPGQAVGRSQGVIAALIHHALREEVASLYGNSIRDYLFVDDLAHAVVELCRRRTPLVVNLGSGTGHSLLEVVKTVETVSGRELRLEHGPARDFDVTEIVLDVRRLNSLIHWEPRSLEQGVRLTWSTAIEKSRAVTG